MQKSKIGIALVSLYLVAIIFIFVYANTCSGEFCGMVLVLPTMPWPFLLEGILPDSMFVFFILVALNSGILYGFGCLIGSLIQKLK